MNTFNRILGIVLDLVRSAAKPAAGSRPPAQRSGSPAPRATSTSTHPARTAHDDEVSPGQFGDDATTEVDAHSLRGIALDYNPTRDGDADPGEVVWTWVPYEENDGRGKDRPVLIVARLDRTDVLAVMLTSKQHSGGDYVGVGAGGWDSQGRPSWAVIDRVFRLRPGGMRREASQLDRPEFELVAAALGRRYGWRAAR